MASPTTTRTAPPPPPASLDDATDKATDWIRLHAREVAIGLAVVAAAVGGTALYRSMASSKSIRAERAFFEAQTPLATRDLGAAERQLRTVAQRYDGTAGGAQAQMTLAQILFDQGKFQEGLAILKDADDAPDVLKPSVRLLTAAGYEGLNRYAEAAKLYEDAAGSARAEIRKAELQANAARAYQLAGKNDEALRIWSDLAKREDAPVADEARVRVGELVARTGKR